MLKFVILDHHPQRTVHGDSIARTSQRHIDWMFESRAEGPLTTFATLSIPTFNETILATQLDDHRTDYLQYEGPISKQRGHVERIAHGTWSGELAALAKLVFDAESNHYANEIWEIRITSKVHSDSESEESADCSTAGLLRSLKRLL